VVDGAGGAAVGIFADDPGIELVAGDIGPQVTIAGLGGGGAAGIVQADMDDALMLRRWSYQMGIGAMASSTLDFELVTKP